VSQGQTRSLADDKEADAELPSTEPVSGRRLWRWVLFALGSITVFLGIVGIRSVGPARFRQCQDNLRTIGLCLTSYHSMKGRFPEAITHSDDGAPMHSWRLQLHPYYGRDTFSESYDFGEPWNGSRNRLLTDDIPDTFQGKGGVEFECVYFPDFFRCPSAPRSQGRLCTNYVMLIDDVSPNFRGTVASGLDGAVVVLEITDSDILWLEPRDVTISELRSMMSDASHRGTVGYHGGACIAHADGSVEILDEATTEERLRELLAQ
jgi:hypothetical protein